MKITATLFKEVLYVKGAFTYGDLVTLGIGSIFFIQELMKKDRIALVEKEWWTKMAVTP